MTPPAVLIEDLHFAYPGAKSPVLEGLTLTIPEGETVALLGPNGAGKTTLLLHLNGILRGKGRIEILGTPVTPRNLPTVRSLVGLVFQNSDDQLFMPTLLEDVTFGPLNQGLDPLAAEEQARKALERVGVRAPLDRPPHRLSEGEKRLVALASVLAMEPSLLVLDEPGTFLDGRGRTRLVAVLNELPTTKIIATHDLSLASRTCRQACLMDQGRIIHYGPLDPLLADQALLEAHGLC